MDSERVSGGGGGKLSRGSEGKGERGGKTETRRAELTMFFSAGAGRSVRGGAINVYAALLKGEREVWDAGRGEMVELCGKTVTLVLCDVSSDASPSFRT